MYIIKEGKAYLVDGEVAYLVNFDTTGKMLIDKDTTESILNEVVYTYDEMYAKLNIAYQIAEKKQEDALNGIENEVIDELNKKVADLTKENEKLKSLLAEKKIETKPIEAKDTNEEEKPVDEEETKENKKNKK